MPTFRTAPSSSLTEAVRRLVASGGGKLSPLQELQADQLAAQTAQQTSLAQKARIEAEQMQREGVAAQEAERLAPQRRTEFAAHSAGINLPEATQLARHIRGELDQNPQGAEDATGNLYGDVPVARPASVAPGQDRLFRGALAATMANMLGSGKTNAEQLTAAAGNVQTQNLVQMVQDAIAKGDFQGASAISQGAKPGTQIKLHENIGTTGATFAPASGGVAADPRAQPTNALLRATLEGEAAKAAQARAAAAKSTAEAASERTGGGTGKPPAGYRYKEGEPGVLEPIPGGPATVLSPEQAAKTELLNNGIRDVQRFRELVLKDGKPDRLLLAGMAVPGGGVVGTDSRLAYSFIYNAIEAKLRAESGAAVPDSEVVRMAKRFVPSAVDNDKTIKSKVDRLEEFLGGSMGRIKGQPGAGERTRNLKAIVDSGGKAKFLGFE